MGIEEIHKSINKKFNSTVKINDKYFIKKKLRIIPLKQVLLLFSRNFIGYHMINFKLITFFREVLVIYHTLKEFQN